MRLLFLAMLISACLPLTAQVDRFHRNIRVSQADTLIRNHHGKGDLLILDVRTPGEFREGHIRGAINADYWGDHFEELVRALDTTSICLVYCTSGVRSGGAVRKMRRMGFIRTYNLKAGIFGWRAAGFKVVNY